MDARSDATVRGSPPACLLAADLLRAASRELRCLRLVRGASRRTARRVARATAVLIAAAALLGAGPLARPARASDPHFRSPYPFGLTPVLARADPAFADIDGDGDVDAFVGSGDGATLFFRNTGSAQVPAFATRVRSAFGLGDVGAAATPTFADIDGDGDLDAFVGSSGGDTFFFPNTGSATSPAFAEPLANPFGLIGLDASSNPCFADIDGDGDLDAIVGARGGYTVFFENTGTAQAPAFAPADDFVNVSDDSAPTVADIDGDGDLDVFVGDTDGNTVFFHNTGSSQAPAFAAAVTNPFGLADVGRRGSPAFVDIDGDGDLDAVVGAGDGNIFFFRNTGSATEPAFVAPLGFAFAAADGRLAFVDIDGDGDLDGFASHREATLFFANTGSAQAPAFAAPVTNPFGLADVRLRSKPALADIDGDGDLDALIGDYDGNMIFFRNSGTAQAPAFAGPTTNPFGLADVGSDNSPVFADVDGDGDLDGFVGERSGNTFFFANSGSARAPAFAPPVGLVDVGFLSTTALADVDGDGDLDAFIGESRGDTFFFRNTGTARVPAFAAPVANPFGLANVVPYSGPAFADIDGDGDLDAFLTGRGLTFFFENRAPCPDCDDSGLVDIAELIRGVSIALGSLDLSACAAMDGNADGAVTIGELIAAVNAVLGGCPP